MLTNRKIWNINFKLNDNWTISQIIIIPNNQLATIKLQADAKSIIDTIRIISLTWNLVTKCVVSSNLDHFKDLKQVIEINKTMLDKLFFDKYLQTMELVT